MFTCSAQTEMKSKDAKRYGIGKPRTNCAGRNRKAICDVLVSVCSEQHLGVWPGQMTAHRNPAMSFCLRVCGVFLLVQLILCHVWLTVGKLALYSLVVNVSKNCFAQESS